MVIRVNNKKQNYSNVIKLLVKPYFLNKYQYHIPHKYLYFENQIYSYFETDSFECLHWPSLNNYQNSFSYYETRKKSILVNIELYNVDEQIKNHFY